MINNNSKFNLSEKIFIKNIADLLILFIVFSTLTALKIMSTTSLQTFIVILLLFILIFAAQICVNIWLNLTLKKAITKDTQTLTNNLDILLNNLIKQKQNLQSYLNKTDNCVTKFENLKENLAQINLSTEIIENTTKNIVNSLKEDNKLSEKSQKNLILLKEQIQTISELVLQLSELNNQILSNVSLVENITEQTNMLALNATVEAARAGEHGKGFAVVASEIRKLADEAKQSTNKISSLADNLQNITHSTIMEVEESSKKIETTIQNSNLQMPENILKSIKPISDNLEILCSKIKDETCAEINDTISDLNNTLKNDLNTINEIKISD